VIDRSHDPLREMVKEAVRQALSENGSPGLSSVKPGKSQSVSPTEYYAPWTGAAYEAHPSHHKFDIDEATFTVSDLLEFVETQRCTVEKDRSCDHCDLCRSLGF